MLRNQRNRTIESIKIGEFDKKQSFHYGVLQFRDIPNIEEQGRILECYFTDKNFLLLPRNELVRTETNVEGCEVEVHYYTSLIILWTDPYVINDMDGLVNSPMVFTLRKMVEVEDKIRVQQKFILENGRYNITVGQTPMFGDNDAQYSYLITHRYVDNKYIYRITSAASFKEHFDLLKNHNLSDNTILDMVFTGRTTNGWNNTYTFNNYKIKDAYVTDDRAILSNVKGIQDFEGMDSVWRGVTFFNYILDWACPLETSDGYYQSMQIKFINCYPENITTVRDGEVFVNGLHLDTNPIVGDIVIPNDKELRRIIFETLFRSGTKASIGEFVASKQCLDDVIKKFDQARRAEAKRNYSEQKMDLIGTITQTRRQIEETKERIMLGEYRAQNFIPFPDIIIPKRPSENYVIDVYSMLEEKNGKYILRGEEANNEE